MKSRPQVGMGQECDFWGYGPSSMTVADRARRTTLGPLIICRCWSLRGPRSSAPSWEKSCCWSDRGLRAGLPSTVDSGVPCRDISIISLCCWLVIETPEVLYASPGGELSADSSPSLSGPTEAETDRRRSEGRCVAPVTEAIAAAVTDTDGGIDDRLLRCL